MANFIVNRFMAVLHILVRLFKRAMCCFRRRRRPSCEPITLTNVNVISSVEKMGGDIQNWNTWDENLTVVTDSKPVNPIQQQIEIYRQQRLASESEDGEPEPDFFQDMTPRITRQAKVLLKNEDTQSTGNRFNYSLDADPVFNSSELGLWEESQSWEEQAKEDWDANNVLREKKRQEREQRMLEQQRKKMERDYISGRHVPVARLS